MDLSKKNHGVTTTSQMGSKWVESYGKDDSDVTGSAGKERNPHNMGGGIDNLSHSLSGCKANQKGA